ncbi:MAG: acetyl-CoA carboxylase biotin carboxyl carrier protein [Nitrospirae bacterium]|nr:acetyl-CoA carboxylase biotin carboxyl carrier protein [Nitrospirota bacterium]MBF0591187.1 acetyl-CoA carboxylase biotin carboxyl carrier protein [Nitrospirota bacterium]
MDINLIKELIETLKATDITELFYEHDGLKIKLRRHKPPSERAVVASSPAVAASPEPVAPATDTRCNLITVKSPIVGTFYRSSSPESKVFVEVGDRIKKGHVLCVIEAMKLMNEIESEVDGTITDILVENATAVEYAEPLFLIEPV